MLRELKRSYGQLMRTGCLPTVASSEREGGAKSLICKEEQVHGAEMLDAGFVDGPGIGEKEASDIGRIALRRRQRAI